MRDELLSYYERELGFLRLAALLGLRMRGKAGRQRRRGGTGQKRATLHRLSPYGLLIARPSRRRFA